MPRDNKQTPPEVTRLAAHIKHQREILQKLYSTENAAFLNAEQFLTPSGNELPLKKLIDSIEYQQDHLKEVHDDLLDRQEALELIQTNDNYIDMLGEFLRLPPEIQTAKSNKEYQKFLRHNLDQDTHGRMHSLLKKVNDVAERFFNFVDNPELERTHRPKTIDTNTEPSEREYEQMDQWDREHLSEDHYREQQSLEQDIISLDKDIQQLIYLEDSLGTNIFETYLNSVAYSLNITWFQIPFGAYEGFEKVHHTNLRKGREYEPGQTTFKPNPLLVTPPNKGT